MSDGVSDFTGLICILGGIFIVILIYALISYIIFCKGLKQFLIKNQICTKWYWVPYYSTYLMGKIIEKEIATPEYYIKNAGNIFLIGSIVPNILPGKIGCVVAILYLLYTLYCYYQMGKKYQYGIQTVLWSIFGLEGVALLHIQKKHFQEGKQYVNRPNVN